VAKKIISYNVNVIRAAIEKGLLDWLAGSGADIVCFQETKLSPDVGSFEDFSEFSQYHVHASKKGYSGVGAWCRVEPNEVEDGIGVAEFDTEGRTQILHFEDFVLLNCYFPNGKKGPDRLKYKMDFYEAFLEKIEELRKKNDVVFCGDVNTAHREIDLARPKENSTVSGFLPIEREWIDRIVGMGWVDTYRSVHGDEVGYTWWDYKTGARERNIGWRIDYFFVNDEMKQQVKDSFIMQEVMGSDHCPIGLIIE